MPPLSQQEAIANLQGFDVARVLAWLEVFRSLDPCCQHSPSHRCLPRQQLDALFIIQWFPDDHISAILQWGGQFGQYLLPFVARQSRVNETS